VTEQPLDAVIVGGGIAGLTAAWRLRGRSIVLLEASDRLGGRIRSERRGDYWLNFGAHVFGAPGSATGRLLTELGVAAEPVPGRLAAVALKGAIVKSGPVELFPLRLPLTMSARLALVRAGLKLRFAVRRYGNIAAERAGEDPATRQQRMLEFLDDRSFAEFIGPLPGDVSALFRSTLTRSSGEPGDLAAGYGIGYFHLVWNRSQGLSRNILGGPSTLIDALAQGVAGRIETGAVVTAVEPRGETATVRYRRDGEEHRLEARAVVVAAPAYEVRRIVADLPNDTAAALDAIPYGPYVVGALKTGEHGPMPWDDVYAIATPGRSFSMLFNTANVLRTGPRQPGGTLMVYAAADFARALDGEDDEAVAARYRDDLDQLFPGARDVIEETVVLRLPSGIPYPRPGRSRLQPALTRSLAPVHLAGDYLGTWYTETSVQTATAAAAVIEQRLAARARPAGG
jgi:oxygen-dependent protoporphyrinogen oxidase